MRPTVDKVVGASRQYGGQRRAGPGSGAHHCNAAVPGRLQYFAAAWVRSQRLVSSSRRNERKVVAPRYLAAACQRQTVAPVTKMMEAMALAPAHHRNDEGSGTHNGAR